MKLNDEILELIRKQFMLIIMNNEVYKDIKLYISNEQQFVKEKNREKGAIYVVVKFIQGSLNFGQTILPVQFDVIAEKNKIELTQQLLFEYANTYNLTLDEEGLIKQIYTTPSIANNFNEVFDGFRSLLYFTGTFVISNNALNCDIYYKGKKLELITNSITFNVNLDSQAFYNTQNFTKSLGLVGTMTLTIASYFINDEICIDVLKMIKKDLGVNNSFVFTLEFKNSNGVKLENVEFKLVTFVSQENIGEAPMMSMTFTN